MTILDKLQYLGPEIALLLAACVVMVLGLSPNLRVRNLCAPFVIAALAIALVLALNTPTGAGPLPNLLPYAKGVVAGIGIMLALLVAGTVDREEEEEVQRGSRPFDALRTNRAEFWAFFLFSLTGVMLCASADDLIWLFLALELTSLPTYVMVTLSTRGTRSQEAGVKYFFLGALGAATFLYGFALLYGGTGTTSLITMRAAIAEHGLNSIALAGLLLSVVGVSFKIAAVPMHFYTPDVYQGAAPQVSAFLAFAPKAAGFFAIILLLTPVGWDDGGLPEVVRVTLWVMAALTMTVGNVLALLQSSVKRILAYSSIAHSGYMLVGVIAGPGEAGRVGTSGLAAVLFYLLAYGVMNMGVFAVLACLERDPPRGDDREVDEVSNLRGLCRTHPVLGWTMVLCSASLLGLPPLVGFFGKLLLFTAGISAGEIVLVILLGLNSAIAAWYYLRLCVVPLLEDPDPTGPRLVHSPVHSRVWAAAASAAGVVALALFGNALIERSGEAAQLETRLPDHPVYRPPPPQPEPVPFDDDHYIINGG